MDFFCITLITPVKRLEFHNLLPPGRKGGAGPPWETDPAVTVAEIISIGAATVFCLCVKNVTLSLPLASLELKSQVYNQFRKCISKSWETNIQLNNTLMVQRGEDLVFSSPCFLPPLIFSLTLPTSFSHPLRKKEAWFPDTYCTTSTYKISCHFRIFEIFSHAFYRQT